MRKLRKFILIICAAVLLFAAFMLAVSADERPTLTVSALDAKAVYGDAPKEYNASFSGFTGGDTVGSIGGTLTFVCDYEQGDRTGEYDIVPGGLTSEKYNIVYKKGTLRVSPREIVISVRDIRDFVGEPKNELKYVIYTGEAYGTDILDIKLKCDVDMNVAGAYPITAEFESPNYALTSENGTYYVLRNSLTSNGITLTFGRGANPDYEFTVINMPLVGYDNSELYRTFGSRLCFESVYYTRLSSDAGNVDSVVDMTIEIPYPEKYDKDNKLCLIGLDDAGKWLIVDAEKKDGCFVFTPEKLTTYAVIYGDRAVSNGMLAVTIVLGLVTVGLCVYMIIIKVKTKKKQK